MTVLGLVHLGLVGEPSAAGRVLCGPRMRADRGGDAFGTEHSKKASRHSARPLTIATHLSRYIFETSCKLVSFTTLGWQHLAARFGFQNLTHSSVTFRSCVVQ